MLSRAGMTLDTGVIASHDAPQLRQDLLQTKSTKKKRSLLDTIEENDDEALDPTSESALKLLSLQQSLSSPQEMTMTVLQTSHGGEDISWQSIQVDAPDRDIEGDLASISSIMPKKPSG